jgi:hypothetical protein
MPGNRKFSYETRTTLVAPDFLCKNLHQFKIIILLSDIRYVLLTGELNNALRDSQNKLHVSHCNNHELYIILHHI